MRRLALIVLAVVAASVVAAATVTVWRGRLANIGGRVLPPGGNVTLMTISFGDISGNCSSASNQTVVHISGAPHAILMIYVNSTDTAPLKSWSLNVYVDGVKAGVLDADHKLVNASVSDGSVVRIDATVCPALVSEPTGFSITVDAKLIASD
jgi:hypothetical protein